MSEPHWLHLASPEVIRDPSAAAGQLGLFYLNVFGVFQVHGGPSQYIYVKVQWRLRAPNGCGRPRLHYNALHIVSTCLPWNMPIGADDLATEKLTNHIPLPAGWMVFSL